MLMSTYFPGCRDLEDNVINEDFPEADYFETTVYIKTKGFQANQPIVFLNEDIRKTDRETI